MASLDLTILQATTRGHAYVIEEYSKGIFLRGMLLPYVQSITLNRPSAMDFAWTLGDFPIIDHSGLRNADLTITGKSGVQPRLGQSSGGGPLFAGGDELFRELNDFFDAFQKKTTQEDKSFPLKQDSKSRLAIRALFEEKVFWVEIQNFSWFRNAGTSKFSYEWTLTLRVYGDANVPFTYDVFAPVRKISDPVTKYINTLSMYTAFVSEATKTMTSNFKSFAHGPLLSVRNLVDEVGELSVSVHNATVVGAASFGIVLDVCERALVVGRQIFRSFPYGSRADDIVRKSFYDAAASLGSVRRSVLTSAGILLKRIEESNTSSEETPTNLNFVPPTNISNLSTLNLHVPYTAKEGETVQSIAQDQLGSPSYAHEIAYGNNMANIWTMEDGSPFGPGSTIMIPSPDEGISSQLMSTVEDIYGADFLLSKDGDFVVDGTSGEDFVLVRGPKLLEQALTVRIQTEQGSHGVFPDYGLPKIVGGGNVLETSGTLLSQTRQQLLNDPRIKSIEDLQIVDGGDNFSVECVLNAVGGQSVNAAVPVGV